MKPEDLTEDDQHAHDLEIYDSERVALNKVFTKISESVGQVRNLDAFAREIEERIAEVGFVARVRLYDAEDPNTGAKFIHPQVTILRRIDPETEGFDHDRMAHEVQTDLLGKGHGDVRTKSSTAVSGFTQGKSGLYVPKG